jgi:hypothetical protein
MAVALAEISSLSAWKFPLTSSASAGVPLSKVVNSAAKVALVKNISIALEISRISFPSL